MPIFSGSVDNSGWHSISLNGYPVVSGRLQQFSNLYSGPLGQAYNRYINYSPNMRLRGSKRNRYVSHSARKWKRTRIAPSRRRFKKKGSSGRGLTFEHDRQGIYRRKPMPKRKRRRWKRFVRKVNAVNERELGSRQCLFNTLYTNSKNNTSGNQGVMSACLYGWDSNTGIQGWNNDLRYMADLENPNSPTAASGNRVADNARMIFKSGVLDLTLRNTSYIDNSPTTLSPDATLETDIYQILMSKETELAGTNYLTIEAALNQTTAGIYNQNGTPAVGTPININQRGAVPFNMTKGLRSFGIKILKKTKYFLKPGQTLTYQMRDPKRHVGYRAKMLTATPGTIGCNKPGWTKFILIIYKAIPGFTLGTAAGELTEQIQMGVTRTYNYCVEGLSEDRSIRVSR